MKKILGFAVVLALSVSSMFAWTNIFGFGVKGSYPSEIYGKLDTVKIKTDSVTTEQKNIGTKFNNVFNSTGLNLFYIGYFSNGLSFKYNGSFGFGSVKGDFTKMYDSHNQSPIFFNMGGTSTLGAGYGLIHARNLYLGIFANFGVDCNFGLGNLTYIKKINDTSAASYVSTTTLTTTAMLVGGDVTLVLTPISKFSIYASVSANAAFGKAKSEETINYNSTKTVVNSTYTINPYFSLIPSVGFCWKF